MMMTSGFVCVRAVHAMYAYIYSVLVVYVIMQYSSM